MKSEDAVLTISTKIERKFLTIDGEKYLIAAVEDFGIEEYLKLAEKSQKSTNIIASGKFDEASARQAVEYVDEIAKQVLIDVPDDVFNRLNVSHKMAILKYFAGTVETWGNSMGEAPQNGKKSSPVSKDSTAEPQKTG